MRFLVGQKELALNVPKSWRNDGAVAGAALRLGCVRGRAEGARVGHKEREGGKEKGRTVRRGME